MFARRKRHKLDSKVETESSFEYLDVSARPFARNVRRLVESWFLSWPKGERIDWLARFSSSDDAQHHAAFFELLLHSWLLRLGFTVAHHPDIPGTAKHPDFLATHPDGRCFYLEARSTDGLSGEEARVERFTDQIIAELGKIISTDFFVDIRFPKRPNAQPALRSFHTEVEKWLQTLNYDAVKANSEQHSKRIHIGGGDVLLVPNAKRRRTLSSVRGVMMRRGVQWVDTQGTILPALRKKASRYGMLDRPYIIAVNDLSTFFHEDHAFECLFGKEVFVSASNGKSWMEFDGTGLFGTARKPVYTRVSAALIVPGVTPSHFARRAPLLISHPWAKLPVGPILGPCGGYFAQNAKLMKSLNQPSLGQIFQLPNGWPE